MGTIYGLVYDIALAMSSNFPSPTGTQTAMWHVSEMEEISLALAARAV